MGSKWSIFAACSSLPGVWPVMNGTADDVGVLDAGDDLHLLVDEMADIGVLVDIEFYQEIVIARGGIDLGGDLGLGKRVGDDIGLAELAFDLDEEGNHRRRLRGIAPDAI